MADTTVVTLGGVLRSLGYTITSEQSDTKLPQYMAVRLVADIKAVVKKYEGPAFGASGRGGT